jgi:molecular chaperone DnaJ
MKNYYEILNVSETASEEEIKRAHKTAYIANHPDKFKGDEKLKAEQKCQEINEAFSVLSNKTRRAQYDMERRGGSRTEYNRDGSYGFYDEFDFSDFFNFQPAEYNLDLNINLELTLDEAYYGTEKKLEYEIFKNCYRCTGLGYIKNNVQCRNCSGTGYIQKGFFNFVNRVVCNQCRGAGYTIANCSDCKGSGLIKGINVVNIDIPAGTGPEEILKYPKKGHMKNTKQGTLFTKINLKIPSNITYDAKNNLFMTIDVDYKDVLFRNKLAVYFLREHFFIRIPEIYDSTLKLSVTNKGLTKNGRRQNLYIILKIIFPSYLEKESVVIYRDK